MKDEDRIDWAQREILRLIAKGASLAGPEVRHILRSLYLMGRD